MIISSFFCFLTLLSLFGYSSIFKKIIGLKKDKIILNEDIFYGVFFVIFFSLLINFFSPLKYFTFIFIFGGIIFFIQGYRKKIFQIKFKYYFFLIFLINYLIYYNGLNVDSPLYHLQQLNWMIFHKINFGIINLNIRFGVNSSWHSFIALTNIVLLNFSLKYYLSSLIFSIVTYSIFFKKKYNTSDIYLFLSISFLLTYSLIHPFINGPILNQLGNPEVDTVAMFLFIFSFYFFLKFYDDDFGVNSSKINLLIIIIFLAFTVKISNISLLFLIFLVLIFNKNYQLFNLTNFFIFIASIFWLTRSFFISGCFIFPIKITCLKTHWTDLEQTEYIAKVIQSYTRDTRLREKWTDFEHTIYSNDWFLPWFNDYFLNTSILKISSILSLIAFLILFLIIIIERFKNIEIQKIKVIFSLKIIIFFIISIYIWLKAPEVRFGSGLIISLPCFILAILINKLKLSKFFTQNTTLISIFSLFLLISLKHFHKFELNHLILINKGNNLNKEHIKKIADVDGLEIYYSSQSKCGDFSKICVNNIKDNYKIIQKFNYRIFKSTSH